MDDKKRKGAIAVAAILGLVAALYLCLLYTSGHNPERCKQTQSQNPNKTKKDNRKLKFKAFSPLVFSFGKMRGLFSALSINSDWRK